MNQHFPNKLVNFIAHGPGDAQPVLLLHGLAASNRDWSEAVPMLAHAGFRAYAPDLLGHGNSAKPSEPALYTVQALLAVLEDWWHSLNIQKPLFLVGHSLGGYLSLLFTLHNPTKVRALFLIDPFYTPDQLSPAVRLLHRRPDWGRQALNYAPDWLIQSLIGIDPFSTNNFTPEQRRQVAEDYQRAAPSVMMIPASITDLSPALSAIHQPVRLVWGENDMTLDPRSFPRLLGLLPPGTEGASVEQCGHQPHISRSRDVNRWLLEFLQQHHATEPAHA